MKFSLNRCVNVLMVTLISSGAYAQRLDEPVVLRPVVPGSPNQVYTSSSARPATVVGEDTSHHDDIPAASLSTGTTAKQMKETSAPISSLTAEEKLERIIGEGWAPAAIASARPDAPPALAKPVVATRRIPQAERVAILLRAIGLYDAGRYAECGRILEALIEADPADPLALTLTGASLVARGLHREAAEIFALYITNHPLDPLGHFHLGVALQMHGDLRGAADAYWTALLLDPSLREASANRTRIISSAAFSKKNQEDR